MFLFAHTRASSGEAERGRPDCCWACYGVDGRAAAEGTVCRYCSVLTRHSSHPQDGFPIRIKAVHIVNEPRIFKGIFAIIKPFLKEKIANRVSDVL